MSSSSSVWHIVDLSPDTSQDQNIQEAYINDPVRTIPDLESGFRVYSHARQGGVPLPSYFYVDDAIRDKEIEIVHPDNNDWMIQYETEEQGQTRMFDIPSLRYIRTTMDGLPAGTGDITDPERGVNSSFMSQPLNRAASVRKSPPQPFVQQSGRPTMNRPIVITQSKQPIQ